MKGKSRIPIWVIPVLALVVALAMFVSLNHFFPSPAEADISPTTGIPLELSETLINQRSTYTVGPFTSSLNLTADTSQLTFTFPAGVNVAGVTGSTVNGVAATSSVAGQVVTVTVPQDIAAGADIAVELPGVVNPADVDVGGITVDDTAGGPVGTTVDIPVANVEGIASPDTAGGMGGYQFIFTVDQDIP